MLNLKPFDPEKALAILKSCSKGCNDRPEACTCEKYQAHIKRPLSSGQTPIAAILACSDSRIIPEDIFRAPPGALFVVRTAGNIADENGIASLEFAVNFLGVRLILVMGHQGCGAVQASCKLLHGDFGDPGLDPEERPTPNLYRLLSEILPPMKGSCSCRGGELEDLTIKNIRYVTNRLKTLGEFRGNEPMILPTYCQFVPDNEGKECVNVIWLDENQ